MIDLNDYNDIKFENDFTLYKDQIEEATADIRERIEARLKEEGEK
jgi:hypothetical protein